jgi:hypothetical protein
MNKYEIVTFDRQTSQDKHTGVFMFLEDKEVIPLQIEFSTAKTAFLLHCVKWNI